MRILLPAAMLFGVLAGAQAPTVADKDEVEIAGRVVDRDGEIAVPGATVEVYAESLALFLPEGEKPVAKAVSDVNGTFSVHVKPGVYKVFAKRADFAELNVGDEGLWEKPIKSWARVDVSEKGLAAPIKLSLARAYTLTGSLLDAETGKPLAGLLVSALERRGVGGEWLFMGGPEAGRSNAKGEFAIPGLVRGNYVLLVRTAELGVSERAVVDFTPEEAKEVPLVPRLVYPEDELAFAPPVAVGADLNVGVIEVKKRPQYRALIQIGKWPCEGASMKASVSRRKNPPGVEIIELLAQREVPCGKNLLLKDLDPGRYAVELMAEKQKITVTAAVDIVGGNVTVPVEIKPPVMLGVEMKRAKGASELKWKGLQVSAWGLSSALPQTYDAGVDDSGRATLGPLPVGRYQVSPALHEGWVVRRMLYNGTPVEGSQVALNAQLLQHQLTLEVTDQVPKVQGQVTESDKGLAKALVYLVRLPLDGRSPFRRLDQTVADDEGRFSFRVAEDAEYAVVAARADQGDAMQVPGVLAGKVPASKRVKVDGQDVDLGRLGVQ